MCLPIAAAIPLATAGLGIAQAGLTYSGQVQQTRDQAKYQNQVYSQVGKIAQQNYLHTIDQVNLQNQQTFAAATDQFAAKSLDTLKAQSSANATLAERGITGNSVQGLLDDFSRINAADRVNTQTNISMRLQQSQEYLKGAQAEAKSRIAQANPQPLTPPSFLGTALQIGTAGLSGYDQYLRLNRSGPYKYT